MTSMEAIHKLQSYAEKNKLEIAIFGIDTEKAKVLFTNPPTQSQIDELKRELFFVDSTVDIKLDTSVFQVNANELILSLRTHATFRNVLRELIKIPSMRIEQVEIRAGEIVFYYHMGTRAFLNASELDSIQCAIDPNIENHDSVRVFGFKGQYTLYIRFEKD